MQNILKEIFSVDIAFFEMLHFENLAYFLLCIAMLAISKWLRDFFTPYSLEKILTEHDNKALGISFCGYFLAVSFIVASVIAAPGAEASTAPFTLWQDMGVAAFWIVVGILLLNLSTVLNNRFILPSFDNRKEIIEDHNIGVGVCQAAGYLSCALIIAAIVSSDSETSNVLSELLLVALYYSVAHLALIVFAMLYRRTSAYGVNALMEADNISAGVSLGAHLLAIGIVCADALAFSNSLLVFFAAFINGSVFLLTIRIIFNRFLFRKPNITKEITEDDNWALALCEGVVAIGASLLMKSVF